MARPQSRIVNRLAYGLGHQPRTATRRAMVAALTRMARPDAHLADQQYWRAAGTSRGAFRNWLARLSQLREYCDSLAVIVDDAVPTHVSATIAPAAATDLPLVNNLGSRGMRGPGECAVSLGTCPGACVVYRLPALARFNLGTCEDWRLIW